MLDLESKSLRGMLIEIIINSSTDLYLFNVVDNLKEILQERLDLNLKFKTVVSDIETKNGFTFSNIAFEDEKGEMRVLDFTISSS